MVIKKLKTLTVFIISIMIMLIAGCANNQPTKLLPLPNPSNQDLQAAWQANQAILKRMNSWEVSGVIGIRVKDKAEGANLFWKLDNKNQYVIQIYGTAGVGAISIKGRPDGSVIFKEANGKETYAKDIQALMQERLGWSVPVKDLYYWGRGLPAPIVSKEISLNRYGLLSSLEQSGWFVEYSDYHMVKNQYSLPYRMTFTRGDLTVKVVIKSWLVN